MHFFVTSKKQLCLKIKDPTPWQGILGAFEKGHGFGLLSLVWEEPLLSEKKDDESVLFWKDFAKLFLSTFVMKNAHAQSGNNGLDLNINDVVLSERDARIFLNTAPAGEESQYLDLSFLQSLWDAMRDAFIEDFKLSQKPFLAYFAEKYPQWHALGKICFHLVENMDAGAQPFAFLATVAQPSIIYEYNTYAPLGEYVDTFLEKNQSAELTAFLTPLYRASAQSPFLKALLNSREIFHPLGWDVSMAYTFLKDTPIFEKAGLIVKVPPWWKSRATVEVVVKVGEKAPSYVGAQALLDFDVTVASGEDALTSEEVSLLLKKKEQLIFFKGKWVELDTKKLEKLLDYWEGVKEKGAKGMGFAEGLKLIAGVDLKRVHQAGGINSRVVAGQWFKKTLEKNPITSGQSKNGKVPSGAL